MKRFTIGIIVLSVLVFFDSSAFAQCTKDTDCKGDRVCQDGTCVESQPSVPPAAEQPPSQEAVSCEGITCSGHGDCVVEGDKPVCACHEGYVVNQDGLDCLLAEEPAQPAEPAVQQPPAPAAEPAAEAVSRPPAATGFEEPDSGKRKTLKTLGHVSFWTGLGFAGFGVVATVMAKQNGDDYNETGDTSYKDKSRTWSGLMWTGFGAGAALMTTGVVLWVAARSEKPAGQNNVAIAPGFDKDGFALSIKGEF
jgi:hypothetical protein